jgi:hypothetical protein
MAVQGPMPPGVICRVVLCKEDECEEPVWDSDWCYEHERAKIRSGCLTYNGRTCLAPGCAEDNFRFGNGRLSFCPEHKQEFLFTPILDRPTWMQGRRTAWEYIVRGSLWDETC